MKLYMLGCIEKSTLRQQHVLLYINVLKDIILCASIAMQHEPDFFFFLLIRATHMFNYFLHSLVSKLHEGYFLKNKLKQ